MNRTYLPATGTGRGWQCAQRVVAAMTDRGSAGTLCAIFLTTAARYPREVALRAPGTGVTITWGEYASRVRQLAAGLARLGVCHGDTVALMMTNRIEFHLADTAAFHLGAAPFSVYNTSAPDQLRYLLSHAGNRVVVCEQQFAPQLLAVTDGTAVEHMVCVDGAPDGTIPLAQAEATGDPQFVFDACWRSVKPWDQLTLIYTSGTTGPPKGVEITHAQMLAGLEATSKLLPAGPGDRLLSYLPMAHIAERSISHYAAMFSGAQLTPLAEMKHLPGALRELRPTFFGAVPRVWEKLKAAAETIVALEPDQAKRQAMQQALRIGQRYLRAGQAGPVPPRLAAAYQRAGQALSAIRFALGLDQVRAAVCGAAPIAPQVLEFMLGLGIPVSEVWGMSETSGIATANPPGAIRIGTVAPTPSRSATAAPTSPR
jgi:long-chain acyl-CoA synthetase